MSGKTDAIDRNDTQDSYVDVIMHHNECRIKEEKKKHDEFDTEEKKNE